ncbi:MAG: protein jag [Candidatus Eremiobacteraeota bacterium]|nr:protein jag [Candidatus Eremiobacteraeota bacterium]
MDDDFQDDSNREEAPGARPYGRRRRGGRGRRGRNGAPSTNGASAVRESAPRAPRSPDPAVPEPDEVKPARELLEQILTKMGIENAEVAYIPRTEGEYLEVRGPDLANLIGRHGNTLEALNLVFNNILNAGVRNQRHYYTIDAEGYRARRADQLKTIALQTLERTIREKRPIKLEPMLPSERKIIHLALADSPFVMTESEGVEPERRVVVHPK